MARDPRKTISIKGPLPEVSGTLSTPYLINISSPRKSPKGYRVTASIQFFKEICKHTACHQVKEIAIIQAKTGAHAATGEDGSNIHMEFWNQITLKDPIQDAAWIMNHLDSHNLYLKDLALRAYKSTYTTDNQ